MLSFLSIIFYVVSFPTQSDTYGQNIIFYGDFLKVVNYWPKAYLAIKCIYLACYKCNPKSLLLLRLLLLSVKADDITIHSFNSAIACSTGSLYGNGYKYLIFYTFVSWRRLCSQIVGQCIVPLFDYLLDILYHPVIHKHLKNLTHSSDS